ncbi:MAG: tetratricopeptide repeat protein [Proteobacteria bacterium]|nr:tetratricopeptide repeat protein [Pseudomonadota bacterium]
MSYRTVRKTILVLVILLSSLMNAVLLHAEQVEKVDYLSLTALMIKEGDYLRAAEAIKSVDLKNDKLDKKRFYTLSGIISLNREAYEESRIAFDAALKNGQENKIIFVYLAQANMGLKKYDEVLRQLDKASDLQATMPGIWLLRSQAYWMNQEKHKAWQVLGKAEQLFPQEKTFIRNKIYYAIELGLYQEAVQLGQEFIKDHEPSVNDYVSLGDALRRSGKPESALKFLELARLVHPQEKNVYLAMAHAYLDMDDTYAAAMMLEEGGRFENALLKDAAELYKNENDFQRALFNNARLLKQKEKLRQRMAIQLESGNYDQVLAMEDELLRVRLLDEDALQYAIAYAHFQVGDYDEAENTLEKITDASVFRKAAALRKIMVSCADEKWLC